MYKINNFSSHILDKIPNYIRNEYSLFVYFLECFYEYLEEENKLNDVLLSFQKNLDVDLTISNFIEKFENIHFNLVSGRISSEVQKSTILKNSKAFYKSKGSIRALKFLFRLIFNDDISVYLPSEDMLRFSDGRYDKVRYMYVNTNVNVEKLKNNRIFSSSASAIVEDFVQIRNNNVNYYQIFLSNVSGNFNVNTAVSCIISPTETISFTPKNIITNVVLSKTGNNYRLNDTIKFTQNSKTTSISITDIYGGINDVTLINSGFGFQKPPKFKIFGSGKGAVLKSYLTPVGVQKIEIIDGGFGYSALNPPVAVFDSVSGAIPPTLSFIITSGKITEVIINTPGEGYSEVPSFTLTGQGSGAKFDIFLQPTSIDRIEVIDSGSNYTYEIPTQITLNEPVFANTLNKTLPEFQVNLQGKIRKFEFDTFSIDYNSSQSFVIQTDTFGNGEIFTPILGIIFEENGKYISSDSFLSSNKRFQDSFYYQLYSYVINTSQSYSNYEKIVKDVNHPAGTIFFGNISLQNQGMIGASNLTLEKSKFFHRPYKDLDQNLFVFPNINYYANPGFESVEQYRLLTTENINQKRKIRRNYVPPVYINVFNPDDEIPFDSLIEYDFIQRDNPQVLYDFRPPFYNSFLGSSDVIDEFDPTWILEGLQFNNSICDGRNIPVSSGSFSIIIAFSVDSLNSPCSLIGSIDNNLDTISGCAIDLNVDRSVSFRIQRRGIDNNTYYGICGYEQNSISLFNWNVCALRYNANTVTMDGLLNLRTPVDFIYQTDIESIGIVNNSSGYIFGTQGFSPNFISQTTNFNQTLFDESLFDSNATEEFASGSFDEALFNAQLFGSNMIETTFNGKIAYALIYDRYISNNEYIGIYNSLKQRLQVRGIDLP